MRTNLDFFSPEFNQFDQELDSHTFKFQDIDHNGIEKTIYIDATCDLNGHWTEVNLDKIFLRVHYAHPHEKLGQLHFKKQFKDVELFEGEFSAEQINDFKLDIFHEFKFGFNE